MPDKDQSQAEPQTTPAPPSYTSKPRHPSEMTPEQRLASLQAFAEEQKYIQPGGGEILPYNSGDPEGGFNAVIFGNPLQGPTSFKMATDGAKRNLPPPEYGKEGKKEGGEEGQGKKGGLVGTLFGKRKGKGKEGKKEDEVVR